MQASKGTFFCFVYFLFKILSFLIQFCIVPDSHPPDWFFQYCPNSTISRGTLKRNRRGEPREREAKAKTRCMLTFLQVMMSWLESQWLLVLILQSSIQSFGHADQAGSGYFAALAGYLKGSFWNVQALFITEQAL